MNFYSDGSLVREARRHLGEHAGEKRGRKIEIDGERAVLDFIELEARAVVATRGNLSAFLRDPKLRIVRRGDIMGKGERPSKSDRERLRKRHQIGQVEYHAWRDMRCRYGSPARTMIDDKTGESHPKYFEIRRALEDRVAELTADRRELFFLNLMRNGESASAENPHEDTDTGRA